VVASSSRESPTKPNVRSIRYREFRLLFLGQVVSIAGSMRPSLARLAEGFRYARSRQDLLGTYAVDMAGMFFGMPEALFPQLAVHLGGPTALGLLLTAPAVGALAVSTTGGWMQRVRRQGRAVVLAAGSWGLTVVVWAWPLACGSPSPFWLSPAAWTR
jgi:hypothetical protein